MRCELGRINDLRAAREHLTKAIDIMKELEAYGWVERNELAWNRLKIEGIRHKAQGIREKTDNCQLLTGN